MLAVLPLAAICVGIAVCIYRFVVLYHLPLRSFAWRNSPSHKLVPEALRSLHVNIGTSLRRRRSSCMNLQR